LNFLVLFIVLLELAFKGKAICGREVNGNVSY